MCVALCKPCVYLPQWNTAFTSRLSDKNKSGFRLRAYKADKGNKLNVLVNPNHLVLFHHIPLHKLLQNSAINNTH